MIKRILAYSSILKTKNTVNENYDNVQIQTTGRHDPCVGIRAVPVGEAMMACVLLDQYLIKDQDYDEIDREDDINGAKYELEKLMQKGSIKKDDEEAETDVSAADPDAPAEEPAADEPADEPEA